MIEHDLGSGTNPAVVNADVPLSPTERRGNRNLSSQTVAFERGRIELLKKPNEVVPIFTKEKFYGLLSRDLEFRNQIAAVSGSSLSHIQKGFDSQGGFSFPLYHTQPEKPLYIRTLLNPQLTDKILDRESGYSSIEEIIDVADQYSQMWAIREVLAAQGLGPLTGENKYADFLINVVYWPSAFSSRGMSDEEYEVQAEREKEEMLSIFGSEEVYEGILEANDYRGGVIAVFGDTQQFAGFLEELADRGMLEEDENADQNAAKIFEPIPAEYLLALVPMGEYERVALLGV